jgi:hypothetical protein
MSYHASSHRYTIARIFRLLPETDYMGPRSLGTRGEPEMQCCVAGMGSAAAGTAAPNGASLQKQNKYITNLVDAIGQLACSGLPFWKVSCTASKF